MRTRWLALGLALAAASASGCGYLQDRVRDFGECFRFEVGAGPGLGVSVRGAGLLDLGATVACTPRLSSVGWRYGEAWAFGVGDRPRAWDAEVDITAPVDAAAVAVVVGTVVAIAAAEKLHTEVHQSVAKVVDKALPKLPTPHIRAEGHVHVVPVVPIVPVPHRHTESTPRESEPPPETGEPPSARELPPPPARPRRPRTNFGLHWIIEGSPVPTLSPAMATHTNWQLMPCLLHWNYEPLPDALPIPAGPWREDRLRGWHWTMPEARRARVHAFDIEASIYAGVVYTRVGFSPGEFVDFLAGIVGLDPAGDDRFGR